MTKSHIITLEHNKLTLWSRVLKEVVILASERISEIGIQAIERILPKVLHLIPWIENREMLIRTRKGQLYPETAIYRTPSVFTAWWFDGTVLFVKTNKIGVSCAFSTPIPLPIQVLQPTLLKLEYLHQIPYVGLDNLQMENRLPNINSFKATHTYQRKTCHYVCAVCNKRRERPCSIFSSSKRHHVPTIWILESSKGHTI